MEIKKPFSIPNLTARTRHTHSEITTENPTLIMKIDMVHTRSHSNLRKIFVLTDYDDSHAKAKNAKD